jgi:hypothetical protein
MPTEEKATAIGELTQKMERAKLAVVTDYRGLKVRDLADLRRQLRVTGTDGVRRPHRCEPCLGRWSERSDQLSASAPAVSGENGLWDCPR